MTHKLVRQKIMGLVMAAALAIAALAGAILSGEPVSAKAQAAAAAPTAFDLSWWTVDGGGGSLDGGGYSLSGTTGQPDAGALSGGAYTLSGGFWGALPSAPPPAGWKLMLPVVMR